MIVQNSSEFIELPPPVGLFSRCAIGFAIQRSPVPTGGGSLPLQGSRLGRGLTPKQQKLADCVLQGMTLAQAHEAAGYSGATDGSRRACACETLARPQVAAYIEWQRANAVEKASSELAISKAWVLQQLRENVESGKKIGPDGKPVSLAASNQALMLIGRELGMFSDRREVMTVDLAQMQLADLMAKQGEERQRLMEVTTRYGLTGRGGNQCRSADDPMTPPPTNSEGTD